MTSPARRRRATRLASVTGRRRAAHIHPGTLPGTLTDEHPPHPARITVLSFTRETVDEREVSSVDEALALVSMTGVTWINVDGLLSPADLSRLGARFGLHPLALEDVLHIPQRPKIERYDKHYFVVMRTMRARGDPAGDAAAGEVGVEDEQVSMFFGHDWVATVQERAGGDVFGAVRDAIRQGRGRVREAGADYLAYLLLDAVVDAYFPVIEAVSERMQALEARAVEEASPEVLVDILHLRHQLLTLRRAVWPMREEIGILQREESPLLTAETRTFLRDVHDHAVQALEIVESLRDTVVSTMEVYLSVQNQKLNEVMKVLTVIATLFIPLTFIASIYGMNFQHMPELTWRYGYASALGLMAITAAGMIAYFRRRGWW
jgi:magnesium transporter